MKVHQLLEELQPILLDLIQQRLDRRDPVKLDFVENGTRYQGYVQFIKGSTLHTMYIQRGGINSGDKETERYVLPLDADERFTLRKLNGVWLVQGI